MCVLPTGYSWHSSLEKKIEFYDGFVICHGTDTMAYTAAALSYLIQNNRRPIVITGAQKPIDLAITDARSNLLDSLRFVLPRQSSRCFHCIWRQSNRRYQSQKGNYSKRLQCFLPALIILILPQFTITGSYFILMTRITTRIHWYSIIR